jgi:8-hydroxy-5-deazaflavin:NADPH oxidoreductase
MKIAVLGTGSVGQALAAKLASLGHEVRMGTRDVAQAKARTGADAFGNPHVGAWLSTPAAKGVQLTTFAEAAAVAELLVLATVGTGAHEALASCKDALDGKVVLDITNPLDFSKGFPPSLTVCNTTSLGEQLQAAFPKARLVKSLNTMSNPVMVNPSLVPGTHAVFMSGNDADAKATVKRLLESFGWTAASIVDLGDVTTARGTEMILPLWVRLYGAWKTPLFNFALHRAG